MAPKVVSVRRRAAALLMLLLSAVLLPAQTAPQKAPPQNTFDDRAASRLLMQLSEALQGHSQSQFLALFDLAKMKNGPIFKQQIGVFFSQTESIRVHLNLVEAAAAGERATVAVDAEMELQPRNGGPALRRNERLNFVAANAGENWKFVDVQPISFFSLP
jgi:hypothetical protein